MRVAVQQLIQAVANINPSLFQETSFAELHGMVNLIVELKEDSSLIQVLDFNTCKHRTDAGLGCRRLAFDCVKSMVKAARRSPKLLTYWGSTGELIDALVAASNADDKGEICAELNRAAKEILCLIAALYPLVQFSKSQMESLTARLGNDISGNYAASSEKTALKIDALMTIDKLMRSAPFAQNKEFQALYRRAQKDQLLAAALRQ
ncbi:hypothetical protein STCU_11304 [Strigomonas culicis]|uniref:Uncharacterized protein n=1 Tax=Strigomonas culicis TaxID=28005 RepID=S9UNZ1_9TRYP|nr:hypothetical protein STCU_11304 [Strigomonas culicis]|eukprot:EPY16406.1 hypothetical protein STCU_11304 [Strigomonas culicis]